ncbi:hypothetical protein MC885_006979, partial [Smutsia gigantea]
VSIPGSGTGRGFQAVTLVHLALGQTVHIQGVIQTPQSLVIQSPQIQTVQIEEEKSEEEGMPSNMTTMAVPTSIYQTSTGQYIAIAQGGTIQISNPGSDGVQGLQALTMTNSGAPPPGATILQYATQSADGSQQFFVPGSQVVVQ